ncbi:unnamed protein product [Rotaria sordida]|uniref:Uncharacterized protein n=1 Tax=Rotaria sordida TaxID=392033 RepID=A0A814SI84_9BILA|nr:unnamed protein product [Rotaria sordida]
MANQFDYELSQEVMELEYNAIAENNNQTINQLIVVNDNRFDMIFGQARPCTSSSSHWLRNKWMLLMIYMILIIYSGYIYLAPIIFRSSIEDLSLYNTLTFLEIDNTYQDREMKEDNRFCYLNTIVRNKHNDNINGLIIYKKPNIEDILKESSTIQVFNDLTCTLYDIFRYAFIKLFCWKNDIKDITPIELQDNMSENNLRADEKTDKTLLCIKSFFIDVVNGRQSKKRSLTNEQCLSQTLSLNTSFDQILQTEQKTFDKNEVNRRKLIPSVHPYKGLFKSHIP